jgi:maltoporin
VLYRLWDLVDNFAIDVCAHAIPSNHFHVVLHVDAKKAKGWTERQIIEQWKRLYKSHRLDQDLDTVLTAAQVAPGVKTKASGGLYKLTLAPTFNLDTFCGIIECPAIRFLASYMDWDEDLNNFNYGEALDEPGTFSQTGWGDSDHWLYGVQMEIWF